MDGPVVPVSHVRAAGQRDRLRLALTVNGEDRDVVVASYKTLLEVLREDLALTGTKHGCELGECGACAVLLDGELVLSCLVAAVECEGRSVTSVEGLAARGRGCMRCRPRSPITARRSAATARRGMLLAAKSLLDRKRRSEPRPDRRGAVGADLPLHGVLQIFDAVEAAAARCAASGRRRRSFRASEVTMAKGEREFGVLGKPLRRVDAVGKVTGETRSPTTWRCRGCWHMKLVRSPLPHAKIRRIDARKALAVDGVRAVLTGEMFPIPFGILPVSQDEHALCPDKVRFVGDPVAAVVATEELIAERRRGWSEVDYEPLATIGCPEEALAHAEPRIQEPRRRREHPQDDRARLRRRAGGDRRRRSGGRGLLLLPGEYASGVEQHATLAYLGTDGRLTIASSTQTPHYLHRAAAKVLGWPASRIRIIAPPQGGGFGGKTDPFNHEIVAAKAVLITGRPVQDRADAGRKCSTATAAGTRC